MSLTFPGQSISLEREESRPSFRDTLKLFRLFPVVYKNNRKNNPRNENEEARARPELNEKLRGVLLSSPFVPRRFMNGGCEARGSFPSSPPSSESDCRPNNERVEALINSPGRAFNAREFERRGDGQADGGKNEKRAGGREAVFRIRKVSAGLSIFTGTGAGVDRFLINMQIHGSRCQARKD